MCLGFWGFAKSKDPEKARKGIAFMINRSIKEFGITPNPFLQPAIDRAFETHMEKIEKAFAKDIAEQFEI